LGLAIQPQYNAVVEMTRVGKPAQHLGAHLLLHRGEVFRWQRSGLGEVDLPVFGSLR
jgi:hypothetical protein